MDARTRTIKNRKNGSAWEDIFERQALLNDLIPKKVGLSARWIGPKRIQAVRSFLDWQIINPADGRVAFIDSKCWKEDFFTFSDIEEHQLRRSVEYNRCRVQSGFICLFRASEKVAFFSGIQIAELGPGHRFPVEKGLFLGMIGQFDVRRIFS